MSETQLLQTRLVSSALEGLNSSNEAHVSKMSVDSKSLVGGEVKKILWKEFLCLVVLVI